MLAAAKGTRLEIHACGTYAAQALDSLEQLILQRFDEDD